METPSPYLNLLTPEQLAEELSSKKATLAQWRCEGYGPGYVKLGGRVYYDLEEVKRWMAEHTVTMPGASA